MTMPGRKFTLGEYRYGFNGKEKDDEVSGDGNQYDYGMRIYNPRLGRFLSTDPLGSKYPWLTPYQYASNSPIALIDIDGAEGGVPPNDNKVITVFLSPSNMFNPKSGNLAMASGFLQAKAQELSGANMKALVVASATDAYNQIFELKQQGYTIANLIIDSHGHGSSAFDIGDDKIDAKAAGASSMLKKMTEGMTGQIVLMGCQLGANKELMTNLANLTGHTVIASEGWVTDWPGMFNDPVNTKSGLTSAVGFLWDLEGPVGDAFREYTRGEMTDMQKMGSYIFRDEAVNEIVNEVMKRYTSGGVPLGGSPDYLNPGDASYYDPTKKPEMREMFEKKVGKWNIANFGKDNLVPVTGTLFLDRNGNPVQRDDGTSFYDTKFGQEYKKSVESVYNTKLDTGIR
jgi:RHS repeat-associated protein